MKPVIDTGLESLDCYRIENYFRVMLKMETVPDRTHQDEWQQLLYNSDFITKVGSHVY